MIQTKLKKGISEKLLNSHFNVFSGKKILITGAAGSIGSELSVQIAKLKPKVLILVDAGETELFYHELYVREHFPSVNIIFKINDIRDQLGIDGIIGEFKPDIIFHAAAYKHIPIMENNPRQAVINNIYGTMNVAKAAREHNVKKFIMISTDKAADPIGVMGASKRIAEIYLSEIERKSTSFITVRFGNVLGSRGSIVPIIENQIKNDQPVTLTDPSMKRYFMTIPDAVFLVLQAAKIGKHQDIFILDMGRKIKIIELANKIIRAYGKTPGKDISISFMGKRPGEKIEEQLVSKSEQTVETKVKRLLKIVSIKKQDLVSQKIDQLVKFSLNNYSDEAIKKKLFDLIN